MRSRSATIALGIYVVALGLLLLWPTHPDASWQPFTTTLLAHFARSGATSWVTLAVLNDGANLVLFAPAGLLAVLAFGTRRWWLFVLVGWACAGAAELLQALLLPGRTPDIADVIFGSIGVVLGVGIGCGIVRLTNTQKRRPQTGGPRGGAEAGSGSDR